LRDRAEPIDVVHGAIGFERQIGDGGTSQAREIERAIYAAAVSSSASPELGVIEGIKGIRSELHSHPLPDGELLLERDIPIVDSWPGEEVATSPEPDVTRLRLCEGCRIDAIIRAVRAGFWVSRNPDPCPFCIRTCQLLVTDPRYAEIDIVGSSGLKRRDTGKLPAIKDCFRGEVLREAQVRRVINVVDDQVLATVEIQWAIVCESRQVVDANVIAVARCYSQCLAPCVGKA